MTGVKNISRKVLQLALSGLNSLSQMSRAKNKKHSLRKQDAAFIGVWVPPHWLQKLDAHAAANGSDRSKTVRLAIAKHAGLN